MLPKDARLTKSTVVFVLRHGRRLYQSPRLICMYAYPRQTADKPRFAVIVGKKTARLATQRNRCRRAYYQTILQQQSQFPALEYVLRIRTAGVAASAYERTQDIAACVKAAQSYA